MSNALQAFGSMVKGWVTANADHYLRVVIPADHVLPAPENSAPLEPDASYFRVWLSEMFLSKSVDWGAQQFPAVHTEVTLTFGNQAEVTFSRVSQPPKDQIGKGVFLNYLLSELMPYKGGVVTIDAALIALKGEDYLRTAIGVLQQFSGLVTAPLGEALNIAGKLTIGTRDLLASTGGNIHLGWHDSFVSKGGDGGLVMKPGFYAVILGTQQQVEPEKLYVKDGRLYKGNDLQSASPLSGFDYMLFRIEGRKERDDWRLKTVDEPLKKAKAALAKDNNEEFAAYRKVSLVAALESPDYSETDRQRVIATIKQELKKLQESGLGVLGIEEGKSFDYAMSYEEARARGPISSHEALADD